MRSERIAAALKQTNHTREVLIAPGAVEAVPDVLGRWFPPSAVLVVADENTFDAAGKQVLEALGPSGRRAHPALIFPGSPMLRPQAEHVETILTRLAPTEAIPVAVGSGTLNDLVKAAAHRCGRPYLVVATAASMDGYTSFGAAITHQGVKRTDDCPAPRALIADTDILRQAPSAMTAAGYADLLAKVIAGADWILADALGVEALDDKAWALIGPHLQEWTRDPAGLTAGSPEALESLIEGLVMAGLAMQAARSSRPASGCEHYFSHLWEMQGVRRDGEPVSHGFKVGLGTLAAAALYERLLEADLWQVDVQSRVASWPTPEAVEAEVRAAHADRILAQSAVESSLAKHLGSEALVARIRAAQVAWPTLRPRLQAQLLPARELRARLSAAGCPTTPEAIGITRVDLRRSYRLARQIRSRYTVLDLATELGLLEPGLQSLFGPGGFWSDRATAGNGTTG